MKKYFVLLLGFPFLFNAGGNLFAEPAKKLTSFTLEELMNTEIYSVTKTSRPLSENAAAVFVITEEDIRRSSAQNVPELLRTVPGVDVARNNANSWAISIRGFNDTLANKLLVLIDGRSVYTPLFGGVYWDVQDLLLEDIERIEVIRGPGGSLWGSNAVNGVINIITKHTSRTKGLLIKGGGGSEQVDGGVRAGDSIGENASYRVFAKYFNHEHSRRGNDAWYQGRAGFRSDWKIDQEDEVSFQGAYYNGEEDIRNFGNFGEAPFQRLILEDQAITGGHLLAKWNHIFSETSDGTLQTYYDQTKRDQSQIEENRYTWDIEWDHRFEFGSRHEFVYGAGYRLSYDDTEGSFNTSFTPDDKAIHLWQAFVQDTLAVIPEKLWLTGGLKTEYNSFTSLEFQPTARLLWQPHENHTLWTSYSRAVRIPSRVESDITLQSWSSPPTVLVPIHSDSTEGAEELNAYEAGYRTQIHPKLFTDTAVFYNHYKALRNSRFGTAFMENGITNVPVFFDDQASANTYGAEAAVTSPILDWWTLSGSYSLLRIQLETHQDVINAIGSTEGKNPRHQFFIQSRFNLPYDFEFDAEARYVDHLEALRVKNYWEMNLRLGWHVTKDLEISLIGQNLLHNYHYEFSTATGIQRAVYAKAVWQFGG